MSPRSLLLADNPRDPQAPGNHQIQRQPPRCNLAVISRFASPSPDRAIRGCWIPRFHLSEDLFPPSFSEAINFQGHLLSVAYWATPEDASLERHEFLPKDRAGPSSVPQVRLCIAREGPRAPKAGRSQLASSTR